VLDGMPLVDAHTHVPLLPTLGESWRHWTYKFGRPGVIEEVWGPDGVPRPARLEEIFREQSVDVALLFCEYSPKSTGIQEFDELLPLVAHNPEMFRPVANVNPHLHFPLANELKRQLGHGAAALKLHPVHGGFRPDETALYAAYSILEERQIPLVVHCGTSTFPGSSNEFADPEMLLPVIRDFPDLTVILAHGGRGWWFDTAAFMAMSMPNVWIELAGLPPKWLPRYYSRFDLPRLARKWIFATDWPGVRDIADNARAVAALIPPEVVPGVYGGNALRLYHGMPERLKRLAADGA
jgi:predicted TIM-barrel fold metal-dependent hydrolase